MFSRRSDIERRSNRWGTALEQARQKGRPMLDLTLSNPTLAGIAYPENELLEALHRSEALTYEPSPRGLLKAREAVAQTMAEQGVSVDPDRVLLTASTSEAYAYLFKLLCDPGQQVLVPRPSYPLLDHLTRLESVRPVPYTLRYDGQWFVNREELRRARTGRPGAVVVVHPNNPTGSFVKAGELEMLSELNLPIISDEVFSAFSFLDATALDGDCRSCGANRDLPDGDSSETRRVRSALEARNVLVFSLFGLSKLVGLPQMKLSWICAAGPQAAVDEAWTRLELIADTYLSVATPVQVALPRILELQRSVTDAIQHRIRRNLTRLRGQDAPAGGGASDAEQLAAVRNRPEALLRNSPISLLNVEGGWYATLRLPAVQNDEQWALELLLEDGVSVYPGYLFDFDEDSLVVVSLLTEENAFLEGIQRLLARVDARCGMP